MLPNSALLLVSKTYSPKVVRNGLFLLGLNSLTNNYPGDMLGLTFLKVKLIRNPHFLRVGGILCFQ